MRRVQTQRPARVARSLSSVDGTLILALTLTAGVAGAQAATRVSLRTMAVLAIVVCTLCLYVVAKTSRRTVWSFPALSLFVLMVFHLGALPEFLYADASSVGYVERFIHSSESVSAVWISLICITAYALGCVFASGRNRSTSDPISRPPDILRSKIADVGGLITGLSVLGWLLFAWRAGLGFGSTYPEYLQAARGSPLQLTYLALGLGISLAAVDFHRTLSRVGAAAFAVFVAFAFPLGLRGEVLFPCAVVAAVVATRRPMPKLRVMLPIIIIMLSIISVVSQTRTGDRDNVEFSPMAGLGEMGSSLQVVAGAISWHTPGHEPFAAGKSYAAPIMDAVDRYLLREPVVPEKQNQNYMSTQVAERIGNVGGSVIGEAYHNFSLWGAAIILFGWGFCLSALNRLATGHVLWLATASIATYIFQLLVRNSFASVPIVVLLATLALGGAKLLETLDTPQRRGVRANTTKSS